jgi:exosortase/archaeosortase family protein
LVPPLEVAEAFQLATVRDVIALAYCYVVLVRRAWWEKVLLIAAVGPIAIFSNAVRIVVTGLLYQYTTGEIGRRFAHDFAGWAMIPLAACLFAFVLWYLARLFREEEVLKSQLVRNSWIPNRNRAAIARRQPRRTPIDLIKCASEITRLAVLSRPATAPQFNVQTALSACALVAPGVAPRPALRPGCGRVVYSIKVDTFTASAWVWIGAPAVLAPRRPVRGPARKFVNNQIELLRSPPLIEPLAGDPAIARRGIGQKSIPFNTCGAS